MIYLAGAYSANPEAAFALHTRYAQAMVAAGVPIYSPLVYGHTLAPDAPYEYWINHGLEMVGACEAMIVLDCPALGLDASKSAGVKLELEMARCNEVSIQYVTVDALTVSSHQIADA